VNKTYSESGQVRLRHRTGARSLSSNFNLLSDRRDLDRLMSGFRRMAEIQLAKLYVLSPVTRFQRVTLTASVRLAS
jgi:5-(hydroxymethyl)furfural/furfural oxidase